VYNEFVAIQYREAIPGKICANPECRQWKPLDQFHAQRLLGIRIGDGFKSRCKDCTNSKKREKRFSNHDEEIAKQRAYIESNREHIQDIKRAHQRAKPNSYKNALERYHEKHRIEINQKARERREANLEHYRAIARSSYERHQEERTAYARKYNRENREKVTLIMNRRRARKHLAAGSHTAQEWAALKASYCFTCLCCGRREPEIELTRDHVVPLKQGGSDSIDNIQPLCARCNSKKSTKTIDYRPMHKSSIG
jgi:5-methylcytosine-specific restriction endonuclease McrA